MITKRPTKSATKSCRTHSYDLHLKDLQIVTKMKTLDHYKQGMSSMPAHAKVVRLVKVHCVNCSRISYLPESDLKDLLKPAAGPQSAPN